MIRAVSISLGSSRRNHAVETEFAGEICHVERIGTDGDMQRMIAMIKELDGKVDCFGLGGMDLYVAAGRKRYTIRDARVVSRAAKETPIVDGSGLKNTLEKEAILYLGRETDILKDARSALLTSGADRYGMAVSLEDLGFKVTYGDLMFVLGLPIPMRSIKTLQRAVGILAPVVCLLPFKFLYPTGEKQHKRTNKFNKYFLEADIIAGDFHYINRNMPPELPGKIIITNTTTKEDVEMLRQAGVKYLVTTTPELNGRSFGTNVMEALMVALSGKKKELSGEEYSQMIKELSLKPRITKLN